MNDHPLHSRLLDDTPKMLIVLRRQLSLLVSLCCLCGVIAIGNLLSVSDAFGAEGDALLEVDQPLASHAPAEQKRALQEGLRRVLVRVSGRRDVGTSPGMQRAFGEPQRYTEQMALAQAATGEVLRLRFNRAAVESLLKSSGLPLWSARRPTLVLWLITDAPRRGVIGRNSSDGTLAAVRAEAKDRGLPLVVPLGDAEESAAVVGAIEAKVQTPIAGVSARYGSQVALVGRLKRGGGSRANAGGVGVAAAGQSLVGQLLTGQSLTGQWWLVDPFGVQTVTLPAASIAEEAAAAVEWAIRRVASPANARSATGAVVGYAALVGGVRSFTDYAGVLNSIKALEVVNDVDVMAYDGDQLELRIPSRLPFAVLARGIAAARGLTVALGDRPTPAAADNVDGDALAPGDPSDTSPSASSPSASSPSASSRDTAPGMPLIRLLWNEGTAR